eukprot:140787-Rhodomonas_salina.1
MRYARPLRTLTATTRGQDLRAHAPEGTEDDFQEGGRGREREEIAKSKQLRRTRKERMQKRANRGHT